MRSASEQDSPLALTVLLQQSLTLRSENFKVRGAWESCPQLLERVGPSTWFPVLTLLLGLSLCSVASAAVTSLRLRSLGLKLVPPVCQEQWCPWNHCIS